MKIVKQFVYKNRPYRKWGLGDDGDLYSLFIGDGDHQWIGDGWTKYDAQTTWGTDLDEMREIVKQFGHLVIFT